MAWPWHFIDLDEAAVAARRHTLDRYAGYAQISAFGPVFLVLVYKLTWWAIDTLGVRRAVYEQVPESPARKARRTSGLGAWESRYRLFKWWLGDDVVVLGQSWGRRDEWLFGLGWGAWMLALSVLETGDDYMHITKRLGAIGISQIPLQYLLSLKSLNPIAYVLTSSHEEINRFHRALGRIIYLLFTLHAALYLNFFLQKGILIDKITGSRVVQTGLIGIASFHLLGATALKLIRTYSYRVFFITHLVVALIIPPLIWFHAHTARIFVVEALLVFLVDIVARKIDTVTAEATVEPVGSSALVKVTTTVPAKKLARFTAAPGAHIYLQIPGISRPSQNPASKAYLVHEFLFNPFTIASVDPVSGELTLIARHLSGPTTSTLKHLALESSGTGRHAAPLAIEGPYGATTHVVPELIAGEYDRVLLVAGGVGATFVVPIFHALRRGAGAGSPGNAGRVQLVWAVAEAGDASWARGEDGGVLGSDESVRVFVTGSRAVAAGRKSEAGGEGVELAAIPRKEEGDADGKFVYARPDLRKIVDDVFRFGQEERVAVLFCGPVGMGRELRGHVGTWVRKGRVVLWHSECFEW